MAVQVEAPSYSGPIEALVGLISSHELDILDVPLAPIVDAFVAVLRSRRETLRMEELSEFLLYAAILLELKSQRLLPGRDDVDQDEEVLGWEERDVLLARLLELRAYAAAADALARLSESATLSAPRHAGLPDDLVVCAPDLLEGVTADMVAAAYLHGIAERPVPVVDLYHVTVETVTVAETVVELARVLPTRGTVSFRELVEGITERVEVIVRFLAALELCKLGRVRLGQGSTFGDLTITWLGRADDAAVDLDLVDDYAG